jgi:hypothetical protein
MRNRRTAKKRTFRNAALHFGTSIFSCPPTAPTAASRVGPLPPARFAVSLPHAVRRTEKLKTVAPSAWNPADLSAVGLSITYNLL